MEHIPINISRLNTAGQFLHSAKSMLAVLEMAVLGESLEIFAKR
jgi:hypothetical protein